MTHVVDREDGAVALSPNEAWLARAGRVPSPGRWGWARPLVLKALIGALVAAALVGVFSALTGEFGPLAIRALSSIVISALLALLVWYDAEVSARRADLLGVIGLWVSGYLIVAGLLEVWWPRPAPWNPSPHNFGTWLVAALIARGALLHVHLLLNVYDRFRTPGMRALARVTFTLVGVLAIMLSISALTLGGQPDWFWRVVAAVAILDGTGTVLIPLVHVLFHRDEMAALTARSWSARPQFPVNAYPGPAMTSAPTPFQPGYPGPGVSPPPTSFPPGYPAPGMQHAQSAAGTGAVPAVAVPPFVANDPAAFVYAPAMARLAWPRYEDGRPLPANPDGTPDFSGVARAW
jgi:hypothetical protein